MSERAESDPGKKSRQHWPLLIRNGSVTAKIYPIQKRYSDGRPTRTVFNVCYYLPSGRKVDQRGTLDRAKEHARLMVDSIAAGEVEAAEMSKHDRMELLALREKSAAHGLQPIHALEEWAKARELVGVEIIAACEAWKRRLTKFERVSAFEAVEKFTATMTRRHARNKGTTQPAPAINKSYKVVLAAFQSKFGERYLDDLKKLELDEWFSERGSSGWTQNTYRKRVVTLFRWARRSGYLPRDLVTEADQTERAPEEAPKRELTKPETLARILHLLRCGDDLENLKAHYDPRPELIPVVVMSAFCGFRSLEGHQQTWEDIDLLEKQSHVTKAKRGTAADRSAVLPACAIEWLALTPHAERTGAIHGYKTEVHTILRNHLKRTIGVTLPPNTLRKSWVSYSLKLNKDGMAAVSDQAGHTTQVEVRHYRNARAKPTDAKLWFSIYPFDLEGFATARKKHFSNGGSIRDCLIRKAEEVAKRSVIDSAGDHTAAAGAEPPPGSISPREEALRRQASAHVRGLINIDFAERVKIIERLNDYSLPFPSPTEHSK